MKPSVVNTAVRRSLDGLRLPARGEALLVALSGGPDSVALLDALAALSAARDFRLVAAHLDHGLRPGSGDDAAFCAALCRQLGVPLVAASADVRGRAARERGGLEQAARRERYVFLRRVKHELGAVAIAVAHTEDDQAETLLLRLLRGAGQEGLGGMRPRAGDLIRPLLAASRADVLAHLRLRGLGWRDDPSNADLRFRRNRVRHELLPYLERHFNARLRATLARTAALLAGEAELLRGLEPAPARGPDGAITLSLQELRRLPLPRRRLRVRRALESAGGLEGVRGSHVERILRLAARRFGSGRGLDLPGGRHATISFDELRIGPRRAPGETFCLPLPVPGRVALPAGGALVAEVADAAAESDAAGAVVAAPAGPLLVRSRRPGDRVRVHGHLRSLKRYLIDARVPAEERCRLPLVASGAEVLWLPGRRLDGAGERRVRLRLEPR